MDDQLQALLNKLQKCAMDVTNIVNTINGYAEDNQIPYEIASQDMG